MRWLVRGGSWVSNARFVRAAYHSARRPEVRLGDLGFRLCFHGGGS